MSVRKAGAISRAQAVGSSAIREIKKVVSTEIWSASGIRMMKIPAGKFTFQRVKGVQCPGFEMAQTPFTISQFMKLNAVRPEEVRQILTNFNNGSRRSPFHERYWRSIQEAEDPFEADTCPLVEISCYEAEEIAKLFGCRLPTELEWERAASYTDGRKYPFGNEFDLRKIAVGDKTRSVYSYPEGASPEGVLDLCGNVWEWTSSTEEKFDLSDPNNPKLTRSLFSIRFPYRYDRRMARGGCYFKYPNDREKEKFRSDFRGLICKAVTRYPNVGFRLVRDLG